MAPQYVQPLNTMALLALIFAFLPTGPLSVVFGHIGLSQIRRTGERGRGMAIAGLVLGYLWIASIVVAVVVFAILGSVLFGMAGSSRQADAVVESSQPVPAVVGDANRVVVSLQGADGQIGPGELLDDAGVVVKHRLERAGIVFSAVEASDDGSLVVTFDDDVEADAVEGAAGILDASNEGSMRRVLGWAQGSQSGFADSPDVNEQVAKDFAEVDCADTLSDLVQVDGLDVLCDASMEYKYLLGAPEVDMAGAEADRDGEQLSLDLTAAGAADLGDLTQDVFQAPSPGNQIAIVSGGEVLTAPAVQAVMMDGRMAIGFGDDDSLSLTLAQLQLAAAGVDFQLDEVTTIG